MSHESSFRSSSTVLTAAILILSVLAILSGAKAAATRYPWLISGIPRSEVSTASKHLRGQFAEFSAGTAPKYNSAPGLASRPVPKTAFLHPGQNSIPTSISAVHTTTANSIRPLSRTPVQDSPGQIPPITVPSGTVPHVSMPHVSVPVTVNVNNGELLSELLKVQQQLHELRNSRPTASVDLAVESKSSVVPPETLLATELQNNAIPDVAVIDELKTTEIERDELPNAIPVQIPSSLPELASLPDLDREFLIPEAADSNTDSNANANHANANAEALTAPLSSAAKPQVLNNTLPNDVPIAQVSAPNDALVTTPEIGEPGIWTASSLHEPLEETFASTTPGLPAPVPIPDMTVPPVPDMVRPAPAIDYIPYDSADISDIGASVYDSTTCYPPPVVQSPQAYRFAPSKRALFANNSLNEMRDRLTGFFQRAPRPEFEPPHWMDDLSDWPEQSARSASKWLTRDRTQNSSRSADGQQRRERGQNLRQAQRAFGKPGMTGTSPSETTIARKSVPERSNENSMQPPGAGVERDRSWISNWDLPEIEAPEWVENVSAADPVEAVRNSRTLHRVTSAVRFAARPRTLD